MQCTIYPYNLTYKLHYVCSYDTLKKLGLKEERVLLLQAWKDVETNAGEAGNPTSIELKFPRKLKMRRMVEAPVDADGNTTGTGGWEEFYEYNFPDDDKGIGKHITAYFVFGVNVTDICHFLNSWY